jgi:hypothetical protein
MNLIFENKRLIKITKTFDGTIGNGAEDSTTDFKGFDITASLNEGEFIYEVFYRVTTPFNSSATIYLQAGIKTDEEDAALDSTTGILDTLNANASGFKLNPKYTKSIIDGREILLVPKAGDITAGTVEIILTIVRAEVSVIPDTDI